MDSAMDNCPKCGKSKETFMSQCDACLDAFCKANTKWPPVDCNAAPVKYVSLDAFQKLWTQYIEIHRWSNEGLMQKGVESLWHYDENCWWAVHPEEK